PDGRVCATHVDSHVQVWDCATGEELFKLPQAGTMIRAVTFAGNNHLASVDKDQLVEVRDARSGKLVRQFQHGGPAEIIAASPDGRWLATLEHHTHAIDRFLDKDVVHVWDLTDGKRKHTLAARPKSWFMGVQFSPDGALVAAYSVGDSRSALTFWETE